MSFGAEMQDFIKGFKAGSEYWSERAKNRYYESLTAKNRADIERERTPGPADFEAIPDPFNKDGGGGGYTTNPDVQIKDDPEAGKVLGFIRQHEAGDDPYNTLVGGKKANLIGMTVGEVLEYQRNMLKQGHESTALGAYQFINPTLQGLVNDLKLDPNTPFNQQTQDWLGYQLLQKRGWNDYKTGKIDKDKFMDNLAGEWAALPLKTGKSAYEGVGSNKAGVSRDVFSSAVPDFGAGAGAGAQQQGGASSTEQPTQQTRKVYTQPSQGGAIDTSNLQGNLARVVQRAAKDNPNLFAPNPYTYSGRRTPQQQREMVAAGFSPTMHSKHLEGKAMDLVPINPQTGQPDPDYKQGYSNIAKAMFKAAKDEGVDTLKWGGNWKNNPDLPHWQVAWLQQQQEPQEEPQQGATMFAQRGGMIPSGYLPPRTDRLALSAIRRPVPRFQAGGTVPPYVDKYNPSRSYTQPISQTPASTFVPRRVGQAALPGLSTYAPGQPTASQLTFRNYQASALARQQAADALKAQQAAQAAAAAQAAQQAAAEAAARRAAAARRDRPVGYQGGSGRSQQGGVSAGYGGYGGSGTRSGGVSSGGRGLWAEGGMVPETKYATGGAVDEVDWRKVRDRIDPYGYMRPEYENPNMRGGYTYEEGTPYEADAPIGLRVHSDIPVPVARPSRPEDNIPIPVPRPPQPGDQPANIGPQDRLVRQIDPERFGPEGTANPPVFTGRAELPFTDVGVDKSRVSSTPKRKPELKSKAKPTPKAKPKQQARPTPAPARRPAARDDWWMNQWRGGAGASGGRSNIFQAGGVIPDPAEDRLTRQIDPRRFGEDPNNPLVYTPGVAQAPLTPPDQVAAVAARRPSPANVPVPEPRPYRPGDRPPLRAQAAPEDQMIAGAGETVQPAIPEPGMLPTRARAAPGDVMVAGPEGTPQPPRPPQNLIARALDGGIKFLTQVFGLKGADGAIADPNDPAAFDSGAQRFARGEGAATQQEIQAIDDKIDPNRQMDEGDRQMTRLAQMTQWYLQQGRPKDAAAAAGSLMQYGAVKFSRLGSLASAAMSQYQQTGDPKHLQASMDLLERAYRLIPDGARFDINIDPQTRSITATRVTADGQKEEFNLKPEQLPALIKTVQDGSSYWQQMFHLADPVGARAKETREESRRSTLEERKYSEGREEFKHERTLKEQEERDKKLNEQFYERRREEREYREKHPTSGGAVDEQAYSEALQAADEAFDAYKRAKQASDDPENDPNVQTLRDQYDEAASRFADILPFSRRSLELERMGFDNFRYRAAPGDNAPATNAPAAPAQPQTAAPAPTQGKQYTGDTPPAGVAGAKRDSKGAWWVPGANGKFAPVLAR